MPVFQETSTSARDLRILPSIAKPLPRLSALPTRNAGECEKYEVVVAGAGPAGMFLTLCLARYGLSDESLLCIDAKPGTLKAGQADGLQPRTLEVLKSLGVADEILNEGCHMSEVAFWNATPAPSKGNGTKSVKSGIARTSYVPDVTAAARYPHEVTIHQGRIERILEENLRLYSQRTVLRSHKFINFEIDAQGDPEFPVLVEIEDVSGGEGGIRKTIRTKHLVGADGAHSQVRRVMGLKLEGETTDHIWGVVDFVADTNFPDIRRRCAIHSDAGSVMIIPRERISSGQYLTRLYVQVKEDEVAPSSDLVHKASLTATTSRERRAAITLDSIFAQAASVLYPYEIHVKEGTVVDWWAAYQIGQRMAPSFSQQDEAGVERVFIVGDACHTHSPKAGQGMNVSMMDSYNLSWKLVHSLHGLTPKQTGNSQDVVLRTFDSERVTVAQQLIEFDSKFSSMFSGQIGAADLHSSELTHEMFLKVFSDGSGFTSGCGIEYADSVLVRRQQHGASENPVIGDKHLQGNLKAGRRLHDVQVKRFADSNPRHLQDDFPSDGRYRILILTSSDLLQREGRSAAALNKICDGVIPSFPKESIGLVVVHPIRTRTFEWTDLPDGLKKQAEMSFHGSGDQTAYQIYGVAEHEGAIVVVRPDGYVGAIVHLHKSDEVEAYLRGCLVSTPS